MPGCPRASSPSDGTDVPPLSPPLYQDSGVSQRMWDDAGEGAGSSLPG